MLENPASSASAWFSSYPLQASGREDKNWPGGEEALAGVDPDVGQDLEWKAAALKLIFIASFPLLIFEFSIFLDHGYSL